MRRERLNHISTVADIPCVTDSKHVDFDKAGALWGEGSVDQRVFRFKRQRREVDVRGTALDRLAERYEKSTCVAQEMQKLWQLNLFNQMSDSGEPQAPKTYRFQCEIQYCECVLYLTHDTHDLEPEQGPRAEDIVYDLVEHKRVWMRGNGTGNMMHPMETGVPERLCDAVRFGLLIEIVR